MKHCNDPDASIDALWQYCIEEYQSSNPIVKKLLSNFFASLENRIEKWPSNDSVLEVGCGAGMSTLRLLPTISPRYFEASEFDSRYVKKMIQENVPFTVKQESVYSLERADNSFDHLIMLEVLEHLENPQLALENLFRVAKKSVLISVPHEPIWCMANLIRGKYMSKMGNTPGHINHWTYFSFKKLLSQFGDVQFISTPFPWLIAEVRKH